MAENADLYSSISQDSIVIFTVIFSPRVVSLAVRSDTISILKETHLSFPVTAETSQNTTSPDTVQCGGCRASYPLGEIVRFIEHKVNHCRSSLQGCHSPPATAAPEDSDPEDALALKTTDPDSKLNSVPSISAPINKRSGRLESPPTPQGSGPDAGSPIDLKASASSTPKRRTEAPDEDKEDVPKKQKTESVDADTNTVNSGKISRSSRIRFYDFAITTIVTTRIFGNVALFAVFFSFFTNKFLMSMGEVWIKMYDIRHINALLMSLRT